MVRAYAMVDCAAGEETTVCEAVRRIDGVVEAHVVAGDFDLVVELDAADVHGVLSTVTEEIRPLEGVGTTRTYVCLDRE